MEAQHLEKIKSLLVELRRIKANSCSKVDPNDGDQGACYAYEVDPIDRIIELVDTEIQTQNARQLANLHGDINEKLFGYFKL